MDYSELLFALEVRKSARQRMAKDVQDKNVEETGNQPTMEELLVKMNELDYSEYVKEIVNEAKETANIYSEI